MLETLVKFGGVLVEGLSKLKIKKSDKKKVGQPLCTIYIGLREIVDNGTKIISILEKKGTRIDYIALHELLAQQSVRLKKIRSKVNSSRIRNILKIYLPKISDLKILVEGKRQRVTVLMERIERDKLGHFREVALDFPIPYFYQARFVKPSKTSLTKAKRIVNELGTISEDLRKFIVENF